MEKTPHSTQSTHATNFNYPKHPDQSFKGPKPQGIGDTPDQLSTSSCLGCLKMLWDKIVEYWTIFYESAFATKEVEEKEKQSEEAFQTQMGEVLASPRALNNFRINWEKIEQKWNPEKDGKEYINDFYQLPPDIQEKVRKYLIENQKVDLEKVIKDAPSWARQKLSNLVSSAKSEIDQKITELQNAVKKKGASPEKDNAACDLYLIKYGPSKGVIDLIKAESEHADFIADAAKRLLHV